MRATLKKNFDQFGYAVARILRAEECRELLRRLRNHGTPPDWSKASAAVWPEFYEIGADPRIVDPVAELLGEDVMLWACSLVVRRPGKVHPWHTDIESSMPDGGTATVWIGLENISIQTSPHVVPRSHKFGRTVQEHAFLQNMRRTDLNAEDVLCWARQYDPNSRIEILDLKAGDAVFFDGRLWHGTHNSSTAFRKALLLQYATPHTPIRIPIHGEAEWPFAFQEEPRPPCVMVRGSGQGAPNRIVPPPVPVFGGESAPKSWVRQLAFPLAEAKEGGWQGYPIYRSPANSSSRLSCHASVLSAGRTPHEPHQHKEEELLIMLSGSAELVLENKKGERFRHRVRRGQFAYYPSEQRHTIHNTGNQPATYLMFKWHGAARSANGRLLETGIQEAGKPDVISTYPQGFHSRRVLEGSTRYLSKLHSHVTTLMPGGGYEAHVDAYDVAIVVLEGVVETLGRKVGPNSVIYYAAGEPHAMTNAGGDAAFYIVFEFHGSSFSSPKRGTKGRIVSRTLKRARYMARRMSGAFRRFASSA